MRSRKGHSDVVLVVIEVTIKIQLLAHQPVSYRSFIYCIYIFFQSHLTKQCLESNPVQAKLILFYIQFYLLYNLYLYRKIVSKLVIFSIKRGRLVETLDYIFKIFIRQK